MYIHCTLIVNLPFSTATFSSGRDAVCFFPYNEERADRQNLYTGKRSTKYFTKYFNMEDVVVALDWTPNGNHAGFFVAKETDSTMRLVCAYDRKSS